MKPNENEMIISRLSQKCLDEKWHDKSTVEVFDMCPFCDDCKMQCEICRCPAGICTFGYARRGKKISLIGKFGKKYTEHTKVKDMHPSDLKAIRNAFQRHVIKDETV